VNLFDDELTNYRSTNYKHKSPLQEITLQWTVVCGQIMPCTVLFNN